MSSSPSLADKFSQVGRYGTLSLLKQGNPTVAITAFGIDNEELTFGRDPDCDVRLYYHDVDLVHCKIVFEERKAFVVVLGATGIHVDGCHVLPNDNPSRHDPATVPLSNDSEFEIHTKRFRFTYPPKDLRSVLLATPRRTNRSLRLSMIHSAQVFSPRPSEDPRENLRILQSPLKNTFKQSLANPSPLRARHNMYQNQSSPTPGGVDGYDDEEDEDEEEEEEEEIVLVETNHPRVVQEDKDLVILEDVRVSPQKQRQQLWLQGQQNAASPAPRTPQRPRSHSLHRAVLIRSVQRAVMKAEKEREEEEEEEMEVLDSVVDDEDEAEEEQQEEDEDEDEESHDEHDAKRVEAEDGAEGEADHEVEESESEEERPPPTQAQKSMWRKSLERIWPFKSTSPTPPDDESSESDEDEDEDADTPMQDEAEVAQEANEEVAESDDENDENEENAEVMEEEEGDSEQENEQVLPDPEPSSQSQPQLEVSTPIARRPLKSFMTPQPHPANGPSRVHLTTTTSGPQRIFGSSSHTQIQESRAAIDSPRRMSMGGEPRRIPIESQRWKVRDLMIPLNEEARIAMMADDDGVKQETPEVFVKAESPVKVDSMRQIQSSGSNLGSTVGGGTAAAIATPLRGRGRKVLSEEERKAIQERRRSAVKEADPFWGGGVPGLSSPMRPNPATSTPGPSTPSGGGGLFASFFAAVSGAPATNTVSTSTPSVAPSSSSTSSGNSIFTSTVPMTATPSLSSSVSNRLRARSLSPRKLSNPVQQDSIKEEESTYNEDLHMGTPPASGARMSAYTNSYLSSRTPGGSMNIKDEDEDEIEMDTRSLLEKMKQTVEGMKRRRSSVVPGVLTPVGLMEGSGRNDGDVIMGDVANVTREGQGAEEVPSRVSIGATSAAAPGTVTTGDQMEVDHPATTATEGGQEEFSLLRPAVKEELRRRSMGGGLLQSLQVQPEKVAQPQDVADISMSSSTSDTVMRSPAEAPVHDTTISPDEEAPAPPEAEESTSVVIPLPTDLPPDPDPQEDEEEEPELPVAPPRKLRTPGTLRQPKARAKANTGGEREEGSVPAPVKHTPGRRGRKPAAAVAEDVPAAAVPAKRGRKPVVEAAPNPAPARRVGRSGSATPASGPTSIPVSKVRRARAVEEPPPAESKKIVVRRGAKKVARSNAMDVDESEDEVEGDLNEEEMVGKKGVRRVAATPAQPEPATEVKKGRGVKTPAATSGVGTSAGTATTSRMKRTTAPSKAAVKVEKEEVDEEAGVELSDPLDIIGKDAEQPAVDKKGKGRAQTMPGPTATRSRATKSVKQEEKDSAASTKARATARAVPRSAPAKVSEKEKENVGGDEDGPAKTIRVSRTKKAGGDEEVAVTRSAPARTTRRTKEEKEEVKPTRTATRTRKA